MIGAVLRRIRLIKIAETPLTLSREQMEKAPILSSKDIEYSAKSHSEALEDIIRLPEGGFARIKVCYSPEKVYIHTSEEGKFEEVTLSLPIGRTDIYFDANGAMTNRHYSRYGVYAPHSILSASRQPKR